MQVPVQMFVRVHLSIYTVRRTQKMDTRDCAYSLGWKKMGVIVKLDEWMVVVGIADDVGVPLAEKGGVKVTLPKGGPKQCRECREAMVHFMFLVFCACALTCAKHFNLCQEYYSILLCSYVDPEVLPTYKCCTVHHNLFSNWSAFFTNI